MSKKLQVQEPLTLRQFDAAMETLLDRERKTPQIFDVVSSSRLGQLRNIRGKYTADEYREFADHGMVNHLNAVIATLPCCVALDVLDSAADAEYFDEHPELLRKDLQAEESLIQQ